MNSTGATTRMLLDDFHQSILPGVSQDLVARDSVFLETAALPLRQPGVCWS